MKKSILLISTLLWLQFALYAQNEKETKTLFDNTESITMGYFISPYYQFSQMDKVGVSTAGLRGGIIFNDKLGISGYYTLSVNEIIPKSETDPSVYMDYKSWGGVLEYTLWSDKLVHLTIPVWIGGGEVEMDRKDNFGDINPNPYGEQYFFVVEPSAMLEINLHKYVKLNAGIGYRAVSNMTYRNFDQSALMGITGNVGLKIGLFNTCKK